MALAAEGSGAAGDWSMSTTGWDWLLYSPRFTAATKSCQAAGVIPIAGDSDVANITMNSPRCTRTTSTAPGVVMLGVCHSETGVMGAESDIAGIPSWLGPPAPADLVSDRGRRGHPTRMMIKQSLCPRDCSCGRGAVLGGQSGIRSGTARLDGTDLHHWISGLSWA